MIRLIVCDLDETLLDRDKNVSAGNRAAICAFEASGGLFVPCTGRIYTSLERTLRQLDALGKAGHYVISTNGALISENSGKVCCAKGVPADKVQALIAYARSHGMGVEVFAEDGTLYHEAVDERELRDLPLFVDDPLPLPEDVSFLKDIGVAKMLYERWDMPYLKQFAEQMDPSLKEGLEISFSSDRYIEINAAGVNKGEGLRMLAEMLKIDMAQTMAIGDNFNDLEMIRVAGIGVAVANAPEAIREAADVVLEADHEHDAVAEAIERFAL